MDHKDIISAMQQIKDLTQKISTDAVEIAIIGLQLSGENYPATHKLSDEQVATLAELISQIPNSGCDDARFPFYDYADAILHTSYDVDPVKLIELGENDLPTFAELLAELAAEKRAVYEDWDAGFNDERLTVLLKETKVGPVN